MAAGINIGNWKRVAIQKRFEPGSRELAIVKAVTKQLRAEKE
jgi:hypothetical protein